MLAASVITGPFAKRTFVLYFAFVQIAFEDDFGIGGKGQAGDLAGDAFDRFAPDAADDIEFEGAVWGFRTPIEKCDRLAANDHDHRAGLALRPILVPVYITVFAGDHETANGFLVMNHGAVSAAVHPAFVGIAGYGVGARTHIAATVFRMPHRRRKLHQVNIVTGHYVFEHRPVIDHDMRDGLAVPYEGVEAAVRQFLFGQMIGET